MIYLNFEEPDDQDWEHWIDDCHNATNDLVTSYRQGNPIQITNLYKDQKDRYLNKPFFGKCAYCESKIEENQPISIDHFRPKGGVRDIDNNRVMINDDGGNKIPHPGYYWLAYNWRNLLPTCCNCNTWHKDVRSGIKIGKGNRFPVANQYATQPGEENNEQAELINPMIENPTEHLHIDKLGIIHSKHNSTKGETTIKIFGLNVREALYGARKIEYDNIKRKLKTLLSMDETDLLRDQEMNEIRRIKEGEHPFTMAARKAIEDQIVSTENIINLYK